MIGRFPPSGATPTLGVRNRTSAPPGLVALLAAARRWCRIVLLTPEYLDPVDAVLATRPDLVPPGMRPLAVWVDDPADLERAEVEGADVVLSGNADVVVGAGGRGLFVPRPGVTVSVGTPVLIGTPVLVPPFVRARMREARGLPTPLVVELDDDGSVSVGLAQRVAPELAATAVALASAAIVVDGPGLIGALAWGTPCVTDGPTAEIVGAHPGREVLVAGTASGRRALATSVADEARLAARLSTAGRALVDDRHDPVRAAARLVRRLGLAPATRMPGPPSLAAELGELGTPDDAVVAERVALACAVLTASKG